MAAQAVGDGKCTTCLMIYPCGNLEGRYRRGGENADDYARGAAFCAGVIERAGLDGLNRLWTDEAMVPTPSELEAPGLWLARIDLGVT